MKKTIQMGVNSPSIPALLRAMGGDKQWKDNGSMYKITDWNNLGNGKLRIILEEISL